MLRILASSLLDTSLKQLLLPRAHAARAIHARSKNLHETDLQKKAQSARGVESASLPKHSSKSRGQHHETVRRDAQFLMIPTQYGVDTAGRTEGTRTQRKRMQECSSPEQLLQCIENAATVRCIDASVFGAAMQRCGMGKEGWWNTLREVRRIQHACGVVLFHIQRNIRLTALLRCAGSALEQKRQLLPLGKDAWHECDPNLDIDSDTFNSGLGSALRLCAAAEEPAALAWGEALWKDAVQQTSSMPIYPMQYFAYAELLAAYGQNASVDEMLSFLFEKSRQGSDLQWVPNAILLGRLLNIAAEKKDASRADLLWQRFVEEFKVQPQKIQYSCLRKAYIKCGRRREAAKITILNNFE